MIPRFTFLLYPITALVLTSTWGCQGYMNPYLPLTLIDFGIDGCEVVQLSCRGGVGNSVWSLLLLFSLCVYIVLFSEMGRRKNVTQKKKSETRSQIFLNHYICGHKRTCKDLFVLLFIPYNQNNCVVGVLRIKWKHT